MLQGAPVRVCLGSVSPHHFQHKGQSPALAASPPGRLQLSSLAACIPSFVVFAPATEPLVVLQGWAWSEAGEVT